MKKDTLSLSSLSVGQRGIIRRLTDGGRNIADRLRDLGMNEGAAVECVMISPLGDPRAYLIKGSVIALRREDAAVVGLIPESVCEALCAKPIIGSKIREGRR